MAVERLRLIRFYKRLFETQRNTQIVIFHITQLRNEEEESTTWKIHFQKSKVLSKVRKKLKTKMKGRPGQARPLTKKKEANIKRRKKIG